MALPILTKSNESTGLFSFLSTLLSGLPVPSHRGIPSSPLSAISTHSRGTREWAFFVNKLQVPLPGFFHPIVSIFVPISLSRQVPSRNDVVHCKIFLGAKIKFSKSLLRASRKMAMFDLITFERLVQSSRFWYQSTQLDELPLENDHRKLPNNV
jgi:hypothetical protein